jgi:hypothetical protein
VSFAWTSRAPRARTRGPRKAAETIFSIDTDAGPIVLKPMAIRQRLKMANEQTTTLERHSRSDRAAGGHVGGQLYSQPIIVRQRLAPANARGRRSADGPRLAIPSSSLGQRKQHRSRDIQRPPSCLLSWPSCARVQAKRSLVFKCQVHHVVLP